MSVYVSRDGSVAIVTMSRPEVRNAINSQTKELLLEAARDLAQDDGVGAVVLTGDGEKAFAAGADIAEFTALSAEEARQSSWLGRKVCEAIEGSPQAWIAAVNGFALGGGCELALACDIRLAADTAHFGQPEINLGIMPGYGGTQRLPRSVGLGWAKYLCLSGRMIDAETALRIGLVQQVVPRGTSHGRGEEAGARARSQGPTGAPLRQVGPALRAERRPRDGLRDRARPLRPGLRQRGPRRGSESVPREAAAELQGPLGRLS